MAELKFKKFIPTPADLATGEVAMTKLEVVESLAAYKLQNPVKYEAKKASLFAKYGLAPEDDVVAEPDENDIELTKLIKKETKK